jgi:hypothetical protein
LSSCIRNFVCEQILLVSGKPFCKIQKEYILALQGTRRIAFDFFLEFIDNLFLKLTISRFLLRLADATVCKLIGYVGLHGHFKGAGLQNHPH